MSRKAEGSRGDGSLLTFSRDLEAVIKGLPAESKRVVALLQEIQKLDRAGNKPALLGIELDMTEEMVATIKSAYIRQLISQLVRKDLMGGRDYIRPNGRFFEQFGIVRVFEFVSGACGMRLGYHGEEGWEPTTSRIVGAQILHHFSVDDQARNESVFRWAVVEMPDVRCEFRDEPMSMGDNTDVAFVSQDGSRVGVPDTKLLGISKGAGGVKWAQNLTFPEFEKGLANAVNRTITQG